MHATMCMPPCCKKPHAAPLQDEWRQPIVPVVISPVKVDDLPYLEETEEESEASSRQFYSQSRQVFVLSYAGKPIYSRHGEESRLASLVRPSLCLSAGRAGLSSRACRNRAAEPCAPCRWA